jgi:GSH-dependent disulfide-bond oxidoreductase
MLDLYTWHTPEGRVPTILLAELDAPYEQHLVDVAHGEQNRTSYREVEPNGMVPALVDRDELVGRVAVVEPGAILFYLAEKYGRFLPHSIGFHRAEVLSWLFWQAASPGPLLAQLQREHEPRNEPVFAHLVGEARRLVAVLDRRLVDRDFICDAYSIADMAVYPSFEAIHEIVPEAFLDASEVDQWLRRVGTRPAVRRGMHLGSVTSAA